MLGTLANCHVRVIMATELEETAGAVWEMEN